VDLAALKAYLETLAPQVTLAASDTHFPPELAAVLTSTPDNEIEVDVGANGITLVGNVLTVTGTSTGSWPVVGLTGVAATVAGATIVITDGAPPRVAATLAGTLPLSGSVTAQATVVNVSP